MPGHRWIGCLALLQACACARNLRSTDPLNWLELESEHFLLRTDLPSMEARKAIGDLELVRAALLQTGWHNSRPPDERTVVIELASGRELREFAREGYAGLAGSATFGERLIVTSADSDVLEQEVVKHELTHVLNDAFLVTQPRWIQEGIACYQETLRFDRARQQVVVGEPSLNRLRFLHQYPVRRYYSIINTGADFWSMSSDAGYAFESGAWLLVHWMVDTRPDAFDAFISRLAQGENEWTALAATFPAFSEEQLRAGVGAYLKSGTVSVARSPMPRWSGEVAVRHLPPGEVFAQRAELAKLLPGPGSPGERELKVRGDAMRALAADPGNPLALKLIPEADAGPAATAHPDDWRTWVLLHDRDPESSAAIEKAVALAPKNASVLFRLAFTELNAGKPEQALRHAVLAAELAPGRPDVLDALAQVYSANGRCAESHAAGERALRALPDSTTSESPAWLLRRMQEADARCAPPVDKVVHKVMLTPVLKACSRRSPRGAARGDALKAAFTIKVDGSVAGVTVEGTGNQKLKDEFRRYVESCSFQPVVIDGKAAELQGSVELK